RDRNVTGVQTCALPIYWREVLPHVPVRVGKGESRWRRRHAAPQGFAFAPAHWHMRQNLAPVNHPRASCGCYSSGGIGRISIDDKDFQRGISQTSLHHTSDSWFLVQRRNNYRNTHASPLVVAKGAAIP